MRKLVRPASAVAPFAGAALALAVALPTPANAEPESAALERVEVIGSRISRIDAETGLPVQTIRRDEIERSGVRNAEELLGRVAATVGAWTDAMNIGADARPGFSGASLRGLGSGATLVLLNGRRIANYAFSFRETGVDLHAIPLAAIERVEILKDGASALYGSDAIAGVVNFVLRRDYQGLAADATRGLSEHGGGDLARGTLSAGTGEPERDGYNVFATIDVQHQGALASRRRSFSSTSFRPDLGLDATSSRNAPGNVAIGGGRFVNPAAPTCNDTSVFARGGCFYDYLRQVDDLAPSRQLDVLVRASRRLDPAHEWFAELLYNRNTARYRIGATPIDFVASNGLVQIDVPTTSPFYPAGLGLVGDLHNVRYRSVTLGPRTSQVDSDNARLLLGSRGQIGAWDYDAAIGRTSSGARYRFESGYLDATATEAAFATGLINPFGDSGPAGDALLAGAQIRGLARKAHGTTTSLDAHASRELLALPAGPLAIALGAELRRETLSDVSEPLSAAVVGSAENPPKAGARHVLAAFAEIDAHLTKTLQAQAALRLDHYSDFGSAWNPKVSLRWQPLKPILLRASAGRGFRAPSLPELYTRQASALVETDLPDPLRCPTTHAESDCSLVVPFRFGGNPALQPVRSTQASVGLVLEPDRRWSASVDYWQIDLKRDIGSLSGEQIFANQSAYEGRNVVRGPADPARPGLPGPIVAIDVLNENLGRTRTAGIDLSFVGRLDDASLGRVVLRFDATRLLRWSQQLGVDAAADALGGYAGNAVPRWRHSASVEWGRGAWTATLGQTFQTGYADASGFDVPPRRVGSYLVFDGRLAWQITPVWKSSLGVRNLLDRDPPATRQQDSPLIGYDPRYADPRGRFWTLTLAATFR